MRDWRSERWSFLGCEAVPQRGPRGSWASTLAATAFVLSIAVVVAVALLAVIA
jgi:hypothetical protein